MKKSVAVLGLGKYGKSLAENLYGMGADVLVADRSEELINEFSDKCTSAICVNLEEESEVASLGLKDMDIVVTAMGGNLAASIMSVAVAKEQKVPLVIAKSSSPRMSSILRRVGADRILDPEGEGGERSARVLLSSSFQDFYEVDSNLFMIEASPRQEWIGQTLSELDLRRKQGINVAAVKEKGGKHWVLADAGKIIDADCTLLLVTDRKDL